MVGVWLKNTFQQNDLADDSEDKKHTYSAERCARAVMSSRKQKILQQWLQPKDLLCPTGQFCVLVPNLKLSPFSQALPILVSCLVVLTLAHAVLVERLGIGVSSAQR